MTVMVTNDISLTKENLPFVSANCTDSNPFLRIAICDDNENQINELCQLFSSFNMDIRLEIQSFSSADVLLMELNNQSLCNQPLPDVIFCDIKMPGMDGITFGKKIQQLSPNIFFILLTAYPEFAIQGYETRAFRYLLKPVSASDIKQVLFTIIQERNKCKKLIAWIEEKKQILSLSDIIYLSSEDKYSLLYTQNNHYIDRTSLNEYEKLLAPYGFHRIHRKYIVNLAHHKGIGKGKILLLDGTELPISRRRQTSYHAALLHHMEKELL